jgi:hypothetical protein
MVTPLSGPSDPPFQSVVFSNATDSLTMLPRAGGPNIGIPEIRGEFLVDQWWVPFWTAFITNGQSDPPLPPEYQQLVDDILSATPWFPDVFARTFNPNFSTERLVGSAAIGSTFSFMRNGQSALLPVDTWRAYTQSTLASLPHGVYVPATSQPPDFPGLEDPIQQPPGRPQGVNYSIPTYYGDLSSPQQVTPPIIELRFSFRNFSARAAPLIDIAATVLQQPSVEKTIGLSTQYYEWVYEEIGGLFRWSLYARGSIKSSQIVSGTNQIGFLASATQLVDFPAFLRGDLSVDIPATLGAPPFILLDGPALPATLRLTVPQP